MGILCEIEKKERKTTNNKKLKPHLWFTQYGRERENMSENEYKYTDITFVHKPDCL